MKRIFYILSALLAIGLASCSNEELGENTSSGTREVTVNAATDYAMADGSAAPQTRGTATVDRYVIEVYENADYSTPANVFEGGTASRATNATGSFAMTLAGSKDYYCLLWADKKANNAEVYTVTNLKNVSLVAGAKPTEAFYGTLPIKGGKTEYSASLHRAVANIVLKETGTLPAGTLAMKFQQHTAFDVSAATTKGTTTERTESLTVTETTGTKDSPAKIATDAIFVLAPTTSAGTTTFTFQYESEAEFNVADVQIQANYNTNITGHYAKIDTPAAADFIEVKGIKVAVGNLIADGHNGAKIGAPTDGGLYFQFGSLIGWSGSKNTDGTGIDANGTATASAVVTPEGYTGSSVATWTDVSWTGEDTLPSTDDNTTGIGDPCRYYLKGTWRLPTVDEYKTLFNNVTSGKWADSGGWSWTNSSASHTAGLKFPASGCRDGSDGSLDSVGSYGYCWSASPDDSDYGYSLFFNSSYVTPSTSPDRADGLAVRCVQSK